MQLALVKGRATSTIKHESLAGWRLLVCQPLGIARQAEGDPQIVIDKIGAGKGDTVIISSDGRGVRELMQHPTSPVRWFTIGIVDN